MKPERETNHKTLNARKQSERCWRGEGWGNGVTGVGHWRWCVLYTTDELLNTVSETNDILYVG